MKKIILTLNIFLLLCMNVNAQSNFDCEKLKQKIKETIMLIDSLRGCDHDNDTALTYIDRIDTLNSDVCKYISELAIDDRYQTCDINFDFNLQTLLSSDKKFFIASWDTEQGGTMIDFTNVVICKTSNKTIVKQLLYVWGVEGDNSNSLIYFDTLLTIQNNKKQPIYLAYGSGQNSSSLPFKAVKAFMISDSLIENIDIFPKELDEIGFDDPNCKGEFIVEWDLQKFKDKDEVQEIKFANGGLEIKVPIIKDNGRPGKKYYSLYFDGTKYVRK